MKTLLALILLVQISWAQYGGVGLYPSPNLSTASVDSARIAGDLPTKAVLDTVKVDSVAMRTASLNGGGFTGGTLRGDGSNEGFHLEATSANNVFEVQQKGVGVSAIRFLDSAALEGAAFGYGRAGESDSSLPFVNMAYVEYGAVGAGKSANNPTNFALVNTITDSNWSYPTFFATWKGAFFFRRQRPNQAYSMIISDTGNIWMPLGAFRLGGTTVDNPTIFSAHPKFNLTDDFWGLSKLGNVFRFFVPLSGSAGYQWGTTSSGEASDFSAIMTLADNGHLSINTSTATDVLNVGGNVLVPSTGKFHLGDAYWGMSRSTNDLRIKMSSSGVSKVVIGSTSDGEATDFTSLVTVKDNGNVGMGNVTPLHRLVVAGAIQADSSLILSPLAGADPDAPTTGIKLFVKTGNAVDTLLAKSADGATFMIAKTARP